MWSATMMILGILLHNSILSKAFPLSYSNSGNFCNLIDGESKKTAMITDMKMRIKDILMAISFADMGFQG